MHRFLFFLEWLWGCCCLFWRPTSNTWIWNYINEDSNSIVLCWLNCPPYIFTRQKRGIEFLKQHWWTHSSVYQQMMVQLLRSNTITERICLLHIRCSWFVPQIYIYYVFFSNLVCNICSCYLIVTHKRYFCYFGNLDLFNNVDGNGFIMEIA